ncbi:MAG: hypothetical protein GQ538_09525 [Xanthomonadales bacterium]|nr:hypothetical protein [Xanthomonadales bacterium]
MMKRNLQTTAFLMRVLGGALVPALLALIVLYPHGFACGIEEGSEWHPYLFMMIALYVAWCYLLFREAKNPADAGLLFDCGIISSILHALVMIVQTMMMWEHEMPHMWGDIPVLFAIAFIL